MSPKEHPDFLEGWFPQPSIRSGIKISPLVYAYEINKEKVGSFGSYSLPSPRAFSLRQTVH